MPGEVLMAGGCQLYAEGICNQQDDSSNSPKKHSSSRSKAEGKRRFLGATAGEKPLRRAEPRRGVTLLRPTAATSKDVVRLAARSALRSFPGGSPDEPLLLVDLGKVKSQVELWTRLLPQVRPHYAVKCNPDKQLIKQLHSGDCGFDCATMQEINAVLSLGVSPGDIVYSHPCKPRTHIAYAKSQGVSLMSFDNSGELRKLAKEFPEAQLLLRLVCEDSSAQCPMSLKFGAARESWKELFDEMQHLKLNLAGVSFHVGSGCKDPESFEQALQDALEVFGLATERGMPPLRLLDIGGGFPSDEETFSPLAQAVSEKLTRLFPSAAFPGLRIIAEPGRYFASSTAHLLTKVYAKAKLPAQDGNGEVCRYYLNDGLYGSFNCIIYDHVTVLPELLEEADAKPDMPCALFGPTCDGFDVVLEKHVMPELDEGDWVLWRSMGAYTSAAGSRFNGFPKAKCWYYRTSLPDLEQEDAEEEEDFVRTST
eukprot:CAMPEP_0115152972 /NCGR_PEP_ID=MMETSP0227-20121206/66459_1 /TAXON_ID=89957 /ORGANISM="Polarella glacialis, Strain CCMP 1383" /LENGTH=480 /DNA_ID=CAMNT_0002563643 /DNA_START=166 /DNA_END=1604 /DNA_ORIENTATION=+